MEDIHVLRIMIMVILITLNAVSLYTKEKLDGFDKIIYTWSMAHMMYIALKSMFGF